MLQDSRLALRQMRRSPGFAAGKYFSLSEEPDEAAFFPITQRPGTKTSLIVRVHADASEAAVNEMAATVRKAVRDLDLSVPIRESSPWKNQLGLTFFVSQVATVALGIFGAFGLLLSIAGTFGLASYTVSKRLRELSIRVALGAQARGILEAALGRMLILLTAGSVVGLDGRGGEPVAGGDRVPGFGAGSIWAGCGCVYHAADRVFVGGWAGEAGVAYRSRQCAA